MRKWNRKTMYAAFCALALTGGSVFAQTAVNPAGTAADASGVAIGTGSYSQNIGVAIGQNASAVTSSSVAIGPNTKAGRANMDDP
ncbi:MAG TPA: hypothetical protein OIM03_01710 [Veillonellaceae bacterium]|nr:hypothetical protein [Veillonellaceae bacterium]